MISSHLQCTNPDQSDVFTFIVNYQQNENAIALKKLFTPLTKTYLLDSGSELTSQQAAHFDKIFPNIYYSGLYNEALKIFLDSNFKFMLFITSDVTIPSPVNLIRNIKSVMSDDQVGFYGPVSFGGVHLWGMPSNTGGIREVPYVEGFCFCAHRRLLLELGMIDTSVNPLGWGIDVAQGYLSNLLGLRVMIDDRVEVMHPKSSGYNRHLANNQMRHWFRDKNIPHAYHKSGQILFRFGFGRIWPIVRWMWTTFKP